MDQQNFSEHTPARAAGSAWISRPASAQTPEIPPGGLSLNVRGCRVSSVVGGFGQMWEKKYSVNLSDAAVTPEQVIQAWKQNFSAFWPAGNRFFGPPAGISPGDIAVLNLAGPGGINAPGGLPIIATGIQVVYADDTSFAFLPLEGHMLCGIISFRSFEEAGTTAQVHVLVRTGDPLYELTYWLRFGHAMEDTFWEQTLTNLAAHFGSAGKPQMHAECVDKRLQWKGFSNIWKNAAAHTGLYILVSPLRWIKKALMIK